MSVDGNLSVVCVNWTNSFLLNARLKEFVLTDAGQRLYSGLDTALCIPRTADRSESPAPVSQCARSRVSQLCKMLDLKSDQQTFSINAAWA